MSWVCPDSLFYYTTNVYPLQPTYRELFFTKFSSNLFYHIYLFSFVCTHFICQNFLLLMIVCENLFLYMTTCENFFLFMIIYENLFLIIIICENFSLFVRTYFHLWESLFIYYRLQKIFLINDHLRESLFLSLYENKQAYEYHHVLLISYVPILCFLLWILFSWCLTTFSLNKVSLN